MTKALSKLELEQLIRETPGLWKGRSAQHERLGENAIDTGFAALNNLLPTGGWPLRAVVEIVVQSWGNGELQLLLPLISRLTGDHSHVGIIAPPYLLYAPALIQAGITLSQLVVVDVPNSQQGQKSQRAKDIWWSAEKLLSSADCPLVLIWPMQWEVAQVRRLQLAADAGNGMAVLLRCGQPMDTPVALRLHVARSDKGVEVRLSKSRLGWGQQEAVVLPGWYTAHHST